MAADTGTRLAGKTCLVTAAAQGIGRAICDAFLAAGANVIAADLRFQDEPRQAERLQRVVLDATNESAVQALAARHQDVSVLVNCVGYVANGTILDCTLDDFDRSMDINVRSMVLMTRALLPAMIARRNGSIINIASVVSSIMAAPNRFAYGTTKAAVIGLTMSVARDFIQQGIRCNAICPGTVDTPSLHQRFAATGDAVAARQAFVARQPMGRLGEASEIAALALMLASDDATFMSGSQLVIDGGMSL